MSLYFFDIDEGDGLVLDQDGSEFPSLTEARDEAARLLPDLARDALPLGDECQLTVKIRDGQGRYLCVLTLSFAAEWLRADGPATASKRAIENER